MIEQNNKTSTEIAVKKQKEIKKVFIGKVLPKKGHTMFKINIETLEIEKAKFSNVTYKMNAQNNKEILIENGFTYVSALNKKNALKHFEKLT